MNNPGAPARFLKTVLWLLAVHSTAVGVGLILLPDSAMAFFGFSSPGDKFFQSQGGVFHLVMAIAYGLAAVSESRRANLTELAIVAKFVATVFLCSYYLFVAQVWMILASAAGDCSLGLLVLLSYRRWVRHQRGMEGRSPQVERSGRA